jgi:hypothetical protein
MAKKLVKKRRSIPWGLLILVFFIAVVLFGIVRSGISGGTTLIEWIDWGGSLALWSFILLRYLEWKNFGGDEWKGYLRICSWVALSLVFLIVAVSVFLSFPSIGE